jgi:hypothetical protein
MMSAHEDNLAPSEAFILKLIDQESGLSPWELSRKSLVGMRETQAIVNFLLREELIAKTQVDLNGAFVVTNRGSALVNQ